MAKANRIPYVESQAGWRGFFIAILLAGVLGVGFRLYFAPVRLKAWVTEAIDEQKQKSKHPFAVSFESAELSLARRNLLPEFAVVLTNVKIAPLAECHPEASVLIGRLKLPFRLRTLAIGRAAIGMISAEDLRVDLDGLRARCGGQPAVSPLAPSPGASPVIEAVAAAPQPWWTAQQFDKARANVEGIEFSRAVLQFENLQKEIYLDSFEAVFQSDGKLGLQTEVRIPPSIAYGEQIPPLKISGQATNTKANLTVSVRVSEGSLTSRAEFTAGQNQTLNVDARFEIRSLPLSLTTPLLRKSGLVDQRFNPKFLWLDCDAGIRGGFQGLFETSPFSLEKCRIEGDGTEMRLESASRQPSGVWSPFDVYVRSLDLGKWLGAFGIRGLEGTIARYGRLDGKFAYKSAADIRFAGHLRDADLNFSNQSLRALQKIDSLEVSATLEDGHVKALLDDLKFADGGETDAKLNFDLDRGSGEGRASLSFNKLVFAPAVQEVLVNGALGSVAGSGTAQIARSALTDLSLKANIGPTEGSLVKFDSLQITAEQRGEGPPHFNFESPRLELRRDSAFFRSLEPAFFGHEFAGEWIAVERFSTQAAFVGEGERANGFAWKNAKGFLENGLVEVSGDGSVDRDRQVAGRVQFDFPRAKNLVWGLTGSLQAPGLTASESIRKFKTRAETGDAALGLASQKNQ